MKLMVVIQRPNFILSKISIIKSTNKYTDGAKDIGAVFDIITLVKKTCQRQIISLIIFWGKSATT